MNQPLSPLPARDDRTTAERDASSPAARTLGALRALGPGRLLVLSATALALLGFFAYLLLRAIEPPYTLLYGGLELDDSAQIVGRLEAMGVRYRLQGDGEAVMVPADQAPRLRMTLAEDGLPRGGTVGDEIFDHASPLGTTNFLANVNLRRALEGELARTITALSDVRAARVHLVLPRRELFRRDQIEPSASITLRMQGGRRLDRRQVLAVQHLVAAAVPGLVPERITLVDDQGTLLARGGDGALESTLPSQAEEYRAAYEERLKRTIEQLLERSLGPGRVQAEVSAELDLDQITMTEETFDPEGQVVRSTQTVEEESRSSERDDNDAVTVGNNLPNAAAETPESGRAASDNTTRTEETVNYEISRRVRNQTQIGGRVRRLSVAVLVDGKMIPNEAGELVYNPRDEAELAQIESLVRSAIGFDSARGDVVEVKNMPFSLPLSVEDEASWLPLTKYDLMRLAELVALALVALMVIMLVVRPLLRRVLPPLAVPAAAGAVTDQSALRLPPGGHTPALAAPERTAGQGSLEPVQLNAEARTRAELVERARGVIEESPDEAVAIIRSWLHESS
jgi:flagellar M-ring protein FliF